MVVLLPFSVKAQKDWAPSAIRLGVDVYDLGTTLLDKNQTIYEFNADIDVYNYFISFDYGIFDYQKINGSYEYHNKGTFYRIGPDVNFIPWEKFRSVFYFGVRYGSAVFDDNIQFTETSKFFGQPLISRENNSLRSRWYEMVMGLKVPIWKGLELGLAGRVKFGLKSGEVNGLDPIVIPGYGRRISTTEFGLNYSILYRIPFRNKPIPPKPVRKKKPPPEQDSKNQ